MTVNPNRKKTLNCLNMLIKLETFEREDLINAVILDVKLESELPDYNYFIHVNYSSSYKTFSVS